MRAMPMNCPVNKDEMGRQNLSNDRKQMMLQQNKSVASSEECVRNQAEMPIAIQRTKDGPRKPDEDKTTMTILRT